MKNVHTNVRVKKINKPSLMKLCLELKRLLSIKHKLIIGQRNDSQINSAH